jgi:hypothetical protein
VSRRPVLSRKQAAAIRKAYQIRGVGPSMTELASRYGVSDYVIYKVVHRQGIYGAEGPTGAKVRSPNKQVSMAPRPIRASWSE